MGCVTRHGDLQLQNPAALTDGGKCCPAVVREWAGPRDSASPLKFDNLGENEIGIAKNFCLPRFKQICRDADPAMS